MAPVQTSLKNKRPAGEKMPRADFITSVLLMALSAFVIIESLRMPRLEHRNINPYTIPGMVPAILGVIMGVLSITLFFRAMRYGGYRLSKHTTAATSSSSASAGDGSPQKVGFWHKPETLRVILTVGFCLLYAIILVGWAWYPIATFLYVFGFIVLFEYDRTKGPGEQKRIFILAGVEALLTAVLVSVVFRYVFLIRLP
ncbi:MAG: hypothetical protein A2Y31_08210 [Spirochaetes bacterium GWC2_52_13]|jgi:hypothetical protein|nr:MAG: hypothetical protein A2Y31_08210 [Spirochaetes bacterium GWC2_52_13]HCG64373.1 hypothetical protein [Sphaerochaeta sp.]